MLFRSKEEYMHLEFGDYEDSAHLNMYGARTFSEFLADIIIGNIDNSDIFHDSVKQKLDDLPSGLCGIVKNGAEWKIVTVDAENFEYSVMAQPNDKESYQIQDFSQNNTFQVNVEEHGSIIVMARPIHGSGEMQKIVMEY